MADLTDEQRYDAAVGDLNVLAGLMFVATAIFSFANLWFGTMGFTAVALSLMSALATSLGLIQRNELIAAFVKVGFGVSGIATPVFVIAGIALGAFGYSFGWVIAGAAVLYLVLSVLGLAILERAEEAGVITPYAQSGGDED